MKARAEAKLKERKRLETVGLILSVANGREWLWDFMGGCGCFLSTYNSQPTAMAFNEGRRSVGMALLADCMLFPEYFKQMMDEANQRQEAEKKMIPAVPEEDLSNFIEEREDENL